jgi:hypothetical protein
MRLLRSLLYVYIVGIFIQASIGLGILINAQAAPLELCPKLQYFERKLGDHTIKTSPIWPYFMAKAAKRYYMAEVRATKRWR